MLKILKTFSPAMLALGLGGCVRSAGISTWNYQSGPGYETASAQENRIQVDSAQGFTHEACTSVSRRRIAASGGVTGADFAACRSD